MSNKLGAREPKKFELNNESTMNQTMNATNESTTKSIHTIFVSIRYKPLRGPRLIFWTMNNAQSGLECSLIQITFHASNTMIESLKTFLIGPAEQNSAKNQKKEFGHSGVNNAQVKLVNKSV